jgi:hypothetical protein
MNFFLILMGCEARKDFLYGRNVLRLYLLLGVSRREWKISRGRKRFVCLTHQRYCDRRNRAIAGVALALLRVTQ